MKVSILEDNGVVHNYEGILDNFSQRLGNRYVSVYDLEELLSTGVEIFYYMQNPKSQHDTTTEEPPAGVKILKTQIYDQRSGFPLCISYKRNLGDTVWNGCLVGTQQYLFRKCFEYSAPVESPRVNTLDKNLNEIYDNLFYKENWKLNGNFNFLRDYFRALRRKIEKDITNGKTNYYAFNKEENTILFNARLLDLFGNHLHVIASYRAGNIGEVKMVSSARDLSENGFVRRMLNVEPTEFFHNLEDIFFKAKIDDFDFTNPYALNHIINERRDRLPQFVKDKSPMELANLLKIAVQHGVTMAQTDYHFVVPMYNIEQEKIQFLMPIYFEFGENMKPANALVVDNTNGFWSIRTILNLKEAYFNARLLGEPNVWWLDVAKGIRDETFAENA